MLLTKNITVVAKYLDFKDIFSKKITKKITQYLAFNKYTINLKKDNQLFYISIYSLRLIEFKIFKIYIKIILANNFIWLSKSSVKAFILFIKKLNSNLSLYIDK